MTTKNFKLVRSTMVYVLVGFLPVAANFFLAPVYTKFLLPDQYALIGLATLFQTFLTFFLSLSLDSAFSRIYFQYEKNYKLKFALLSSLLLTVLLVSFAVLGILLFIGDSLFGYLFTTNEFRFTNYGYWVVVITFSQIIFLFFAILYRNEEKIGNFISLNLLFFFIPVLGTLTGLILYENGAMGAIAGRAIGSFGFVSVLLFIYFRKHRPVIKFRFLQVALKFALPLIPYQLMFAGFSNLDRVLLEKHFTLHDFGVYNFAVMVTGMVPVFLNAMGNATNPGIFRELANDGNMEIVRKYNYINLFLSTGVICFSIAFVVPAMRVFISSDYSDSYIYFGTLFLSFIPYLHYLLYNVPLFYFGKTNVFPVIAFCALISGIVFNKLFLPYLGIWAVCFSLYIIRLVQTIVAYFYIVRYKFNLLSYVKHKKGIAVSISVVLVYNLLLILHIYYGFFTIDQVNLAPLITFIFLSTLLYKSEVKFLMSLISSIQRLKLRVRR